MKKLKQIKKPVSSFNYKLLLSLAAAALVATVLYFYLVTVSELCMQITTIAYISLAAIAVIAYFIYNKGLVADKMTPEMLPSSMTNNEKAEYFEKAAERKKNSKWILVLFFVFLIPLALDLMKLFIIDEYFADLFK